MAVSENKLLGVKPIIIPEKELQRLKHVIGSHNYGPNAKDMLQKRIRGMCSVCGGIAEHIASYDYNGATKIERFCSPCVEKQFSRVNS